MKLEEAIEELRNSPLVVGHNPTYRVTPSSYRIEMDTRDLSDKLQEELRHIAPDAETVVVWRVVDRGTEMFFLAARDTFQVLQVG
jgi:hypothetical protein